MRIIVLLITVVTQLAAAGFCFIILLLAMNGYSERQATPSLVLYIALSLLSALGLGGASAFAAKRLAERAALGGLWASVIVVICSAILGAVILVISFFAALLLAEIVRGMR